MAKRLFSDNAVSLLLAPISATSTQLTVLPGHGALFPNPGPNEFFTVTLEDQAATIREIIHVTARTGDVFTSILRGQEGTTPRAWSASANNDTLVDHRVTAATLYYLKDEADLSYSNPSFPGLVDYKQAIDYLLQSGGVVSGGQVIDAPVTTTVAGSQTIINTPSPYRPGSTAVFVGGLRQKRGVDFIESGATQLRLMLPLTPAMQADGMNLVVDYITL